jgi:long-chain fatty acid transport protein
MKIGASYRHNIEMELKGDVSYDFVQGVESLFQPTTGSTKINFPNDLRIGIAYNLLKGLWLEFGINYVGWASYDTLAIHFDKAPGNPSASYTSSQPRLYKNVITYRLSAEYFLTPSIALRCGLFYDPMPVEANNVEPVLPEGNRFSGSLGLGWKLFKNLSFDIGYMGIFAQQTEVKNNPNLFNGIYNCWANVLALSINFNY